MSTILLLVISIVAPWTVHLAPPRQRALALVGVIAVFLLYGIFAENPLTQWEMWAGLAAGILTVMFLAGGAGAGRGSTAPRPRTEAAAAQPAPALRGGQRAHRRALGAAPLRHGSARSRWARIRRCARSGSSSSTSPRRSALTPFALSPAASRAMPRGRKASA